VSFYNLRFMQIFY